MRTQLATVLLALSLSPTAFAQATAVAAPPTLPTSPTPGVTDVMPVMVTGETPGPGLWMVTKNGHVLWLLGTQSPVPTNMSWKSDQVKVFGFANPQTLNSQLSMLTEGVSP